MNTPSDKFQDNPQEQSVSTEQTDRNDSGHDAATDQGLETSSCRQEPGTPDLPLYMCVPRNTPDGEATAAKPRFESSGKPVSSKAADTSFEKTTFGGAQLAAPLPDDSEQTRQGKASLKKATGHLAGEIVHEKGTDDTQPGSMTDFTGSSAAESHATISVDPQGTAEILDKKTVSKDEAGGSSDKAGLGEALDAAAKAYGTSSDEVPAWDYQSHPVSSEEPEEAPISMEKDSEIKKKAWGLGKSRKETPEKKKRPDKKAQPVYEPFSRSHPIISVEQALPPSIGSRIYKVLALSPLLILSFMLALQTIFTLDARELWFSDEIRHADAFKNLLEHGKWLILEMNGNLYPDKPPLYFWFLRGLYEVLRTDGPMLYFTAAAISGLFYLWASLGLGRNVARVDGATNLAAGIMLLSTAYVMGTLHYARMDLLFSALILCSHILLYRSFVSPKASPAGMAAAFGLAGLACLVKGPLALAFPLASIILFALWRGTGDQFRCVVISILAVFFGLFPGLFGQEILHIMGQQPSTLLNPVSGLSILSLEWSLPFLAIPLAIGLLLIKLAPRLRLCVALSLLLMAAAFVLNGGTPYFHWPLLYTLPVCALGLFVVWQASLQRFFRFDFFVGLAVGVIVPGLWLAAIYWQTGNLDFILDSLLKEQVLERAVDTFHHKESWYYYLVRLPLMLLPWFLLIIFLPWRKIFSKSTRQELAHSRQPEREGLAYLWCMGISALLLLSCLSGKILIYLLPVLPAFAILGARGLLALKGSRATFFRLSMGGLLFLAGVLTILCALMLFDVLPMPDLKGIPAWTMESHGGFYVVAGLLLAFAAFLVFGLGSSRPEGVLLVMGLAATAISYPLAALVAPSFDDVLSPRDQSLIMRAYIDQGYAPASYKVYGGTYSFYTDHVINELKTQEEIPPLAEQGKLILGMRASIFDEWKDRPQCLKEVHRQWIETREYVLLACPPLEGLKPAGDPYAPAPEFLRELLKLVGIELAPRQKKVPVTKSQPPVEAPPITEPEGQPDTVPSDDTPAEPAAPGEVPASVPAPQPDPAPKGEQPDELDTPPPPAAGEQFPLPDAQPDTPPDIPATDTPTQTPLLPSVLPAPQTSGESAPGRQNGTGADGSIPDGGTHEETPKPQPEAPESQDVPSQDIRLQENPDNGRQPGSPVPVPPSDNGYPEDVPGDDSTAQSERQGA